MICCDWVLKLGVSQVPVGSAVGSRDLRYRLVGFLQKVRLLFAVCCEDGALVTSEATGSIHPSVLCFVVMKLAQFKLEP